MNRRDFVTGTAAGVAGAALFPAGRAGLEREQRPGRLERRALGRTGEKLSIIGFGGIVVMDRAAFDTILFPVNYATWNAGGFGPQVLARAKQKGMGILCLKALAKQPWPRRGGEEARPALRFTLSHPVTAAVPPGDESVYAMALKLAAEFAPLPPAEVEAVKAKGLAANPLFRYPSAEA